MVDDLEDVFKMNPRNGIVIKPFVAKDPDSVGDIELQRLGYFLDEIKHKNFTAINLSDGWAKYKNALTTTI